MIYPLPEMPSKNTQGGKRQWKAVLRENQPESVAKALNVCDMDSYPKTYVVLKILGTVAATSCESERSGSVLIRLNTYLQASMCQNRLSALVMVHFNLDVDIDAKRDRKLFCKRDRALEFKNICASSIA